jgi:hypothetical protein
MNITAAKLRSYSEMEKVHSGFKLTLAQYLRNSLLEPSFETYFLLHTLNP